MFLKGFHLFIWQISTNGCVTCRVLLCLKYDVDSSLEKNINIIEFCYLYWNRLFYPWLRRTRKYIFSTVDYKTITHHLFLWPPAGGLYQRVKKKTCLLYSVLVLCKTIRLPHGVSQHNKYSTHFNVSVISLEPASFQMKIWLLSWKFNFIGESFDLNYFKFVLCTKFYLA